MTNTNGQGPKKVKFHLRTEPGCTVSVAGTFNEWDSNAHALSDKRNDGNFSLSVMLHPGRYEYKFVINGNWCVDPECSEWVPNAHGSLNSVLHIE